MDGRAHRPWSRQIGGRTGCRVVGNGTDVRGFPGNAGRSERGGSGDGRHCHEADLRHALGLALDVPGDFLEWAGASMRDRFHSQVDEAGLAAIDVQLSDVEWFRGRLGRRTEAEVRAYPWSSDPSAHIDTFFIFGPREQSLGEMT
jgi:hypothetical protein